MTNISCNGPGGCKWKMSGANRKKNQAQPKRLCLQPLAIFKQENARFALSLLSPDSLLFNKNLKHQSCSIFQDEFNHIKNLS